MRIQTDMRPPNSVTAAFIAAVLALLTASLLILSVTMHATLVDLSSDTDRAIKFGDEISTLLSAEVASVLGFQATADPLYDRAYQGQRSSIVGRLKSLQRITATLGENGQARLKELQSAIDSWHDAVDAQRLTTRRLPSDEFRQAAFVRLFIMRRAQASADAFNEAILTYQSTQRARVQRLALVFMALAVIFGPLALLALTLLTYVVRRLNITTSTMEARARDEETLREVGHSLAGGITMRDVLRRVTEAAVRAGQADDVFIETIDPALTEVTSVASSGRTAPPIASTSAYEGSLAQEVINSRQPLIVRGSDLTDQPKSVFRELIRRGTNCTAIVIPLVTGEQPLGAMCLMRSGGREFTYAEIPRVQIFADIASIALHRAMTVDRLQKLEDEERFLVKVSTALAGSLDYQRTLKTVARLATPQVADFCIVYLLDGNHVYHAEFAAADPDKTAILEQLRGRHRPRPDLTASVEDVLRTRRAQLVPEITDDMLRANSFDDEHFTLLRQLDAASAMTVPMTVGTEALGALMFLAARPRRYDYDDLRRAKNLAHRAALAIHNAHLYAVANSAIQARDEVMRAVAHDLRNPLNTIQLSATLLAQTSLPYERHQKILGSITGASRRMNHLIEDLLTIGRIRADQKLPLDLHREDPAELIAHVCEMMAPHAAQKSIALRWSKPSVPAVMVDRSRILQVLTNVLDNALKFTPEGGSITVTCEAANGDVLFSVRDTGSGIDAGDANRIFDPFWQARSTAHLGSGLGLAIAKAVIEQHHGRIWVESTRGVGTTVLFTIPVARVAEEPLHPKAA